MHWARKCVPGGVCQGDVSPGGVCPGDVCPGVSAHEGVCLGGVCLEGVWQTPPQDQRQTPPCEQND